MSVLIRGMKMPDGCPSCPFVMAYYCLLIGISDDNEVTNYINKRHPNCPLVEIPTPHGDLVDKNKLMVEVMDSDLDHLQRDDWKEVIQIVSDAEVVIEAEGREE